MIRFGKKQEKEVLNCEYFLNIHVYDNPEYGYKNLCIRLSF